MYHQANPGIQSSWEAKPTPLSSDFEAFVAERIRDGVEDPATVARWKAFVTGGASPTKRGRA